MHIWLKLCIPDILHWSQQGNVNLVSYFCSAYKAQMITGATDNIAI